VSAPATLGGRWPSGLPDATTFYAQAWVLDDVAGLTTSQVVALVAESP